MRVGEVVELEEGVAVDGDSGVGSDGIGWGKDRTSSFAALEGVIFISVFEGCGIVVEAGVGVGLNVDGCRGASSQSEDRHISARGTVVDVFAGVGSSIVSSDRSCRILLQGVCAIHCVEVDVGV